MKLLRTFATLLPLLSISRIALAADTWTDPHPGIRHLERTTGALQINALYIDTCAPGISFRASGPGEGSKNTRTYATGLGLQAAINGDFVDDIGLGVGNGGQVIPGRVDAEAQGYAVFGDGRVEFIENDSVIPAPPDWAKEMVGGHWTQIHNGVVRNPVDVNGACTTNGVPRGNTPRTAVAMTKDGRTVLFVTIGSQTTGVRNGVNCGEWSTVLSGLGAHWALNLDGGGSTVMYVQGQGVNGIVNHPSDPGGTLRSVPSHLGVYARGKGVPGSCNVAPAAGFLDKADCKSLLGWAYSPSEPTKSSEILFALGGPFFGPTTKYTTIRADIERADVAAVVGSPAHGFDHPFPRSLMTNAPTEVTAFAVNTLEGGRGSVLEGSPTKLTCSKPAPEGRKRWIINPAVLESWKFSLPDDLVQYTDQELATLPTAHDFKDTLQVVRGPAGTDVFVVDAGRKRKIDAAVLRAWRIVPSAAKVLTASEFGAIPDGDAFTKRPELAKGEGDKVYLLDTSLLDPAVPGAASDAGSSGGGDAGVGSDEDPSQVNPDCGCKVLVAHNATLNPRLVVAGLFALVALRRRRSPRRV